ncbi:MAG: hypothetical protein WDM85_18575 [Caulobacteraceae bacterium]
MQRAAKSGRIAYSLAALGEAFVGRPRIVFCGHLYMAPLGWLAARVAGAQLVMQMHASRLGGGRPLWFVGPANGRR